jgi:hypothetical protein
VCSSDLGAHVGYGLADDYQLDWDQDPVCTHGEGVRKYLELQMRPVMGRVIEPVSKQLQFQTDHPFTDTPTQSIVLDRDCKRFRLEQVKFYMIPTAAETYQLFLYASNKADNVLSALNCIFGSPAAMAGSTLYIANGSRMVTPGTNYLTATPLPIISDLEYPGILFYNIDWSGAPGATTGFIEVVGSEEE